MKLSKFNEVATLVKDRENIIKSLLAFKLGKVSCFANLDSGTHSYIPFMTEGELRHLMKIEGEKALKDNGEKLFLFGVTEIASTPTPVPARIDPCDDWESKQHYNDCTNCSYEPCRNSYVNARKTLDANAALVAISEGLLIKHKNEQGYYWKGVVGENQVILYNLFGVSVAMSRLTYATWLNHAYDEGYYIFTPSENRNTIDLADF